MMNDRQIVEKKTWSGDAAEGKRWDKVDDMDCTRHEQGPAVRRGASSGGVPRVAKLRIPEPRDFHL